MCVLQGRCAALTGINNKGGVVRIACTGVALWLGFRKEQACLRTNNIARLACLSARLERA